MKTSVRLILTVIFLLTAAAALCFKIMISGGGDGGGGGGGGELVHRSNFLVAQKLPPVFNNTLLAFAAVDLGEDSLRQNVEHLVDGGFRGLSSGFRRSFLWSGRHRSPEFHRLRLDLRRHLQTWWRNHRFQPDVMSNLVNVVKILKTNDNVNVNDNDSGLKYKTCAVVGNSGILLKSDIGGVIDSHEFVISSSHKAPLLITDPRFDILCARIVKYYSASRFVKETGKALEEWASSHDGTSFHYSSGMQAVMLALGICEKVRIFGFGKSDSAKHHYHTNRKAELHLHDYEAEYDLYHDLMERPEVIPFISNEFKFPRVVLHR